MIFFLFLIINYQFSVIIELIIMIIVCWLNIKNLWMNLWTFHDSLWIYLSDNSEFTNDFCDNFSMGYPSEIWRIQGLCLFLTSNSHFFFQNKCLENSCWRTRKHFYMECENFWEWESVIIFIYFFKTKKSVFIKHLMIYVSNLAPFSKTAF